jgi:hypothetical protein
LTVLGIAYLYAAFVAYFTQPLVARFGYIQFIPTWLVLLLSLLLSLVVQSFTINNFREADMIRHAALGSDSPGARRAISQRLVTALAVDQFTSAFVVGSIFVGVNVSWIRVRTLATAPTSLDNQAVSWQMLDE